MSLIFKFAFAALILGLSACVKPIGSNEVRIANREAESSESPFRWETQSVGADTVMTLVLADLPSGPSRGDEVLKQDILSLITKAEASEGRSNPKIEDIKPLKDGRELWILQSEAGGIAYFVGFKATADGGSDIEMSGAKKYSRKKG